MEKVIVPCNFCDGTLDLNIEDTCPKCGISTFASPEDVAADPSSYQLKKELTPMQQMVKAIQVQRQLDPDNQVLQGLFYLGIDLINEEHDVITKAVDEGIKNSDAAKLFDYPAERYYNTFFERIKF